MKNKSCLWENASIGSADKTFTRDDYSSSLVYPVSEPSGMEVKPDRIYCDVSSTTATSLSDTVAPVQIEDEDNFKLVLDSGNTDLSPIIIDAVSLCVERNIDCPLIILNQDLPDKKPYITVADDTGRITHIVFDKHRSRKGIIKDIRKVLLDIDQIVQGVNGLSKTMLYGFVFDICSSLNIHCPMIFDSSPEEISEILGTAVPDFDGLYMDDRNVVILNSNLFTDDNPLILIHAVAHELRHCWQHESGNRRLFDTTDYKSMIGCETQADEMDEETYHKRYQDYALQDVEIDANAFAKKYMKLIFNIDFSIYEEESVVQDEIDKRAKMIGDDITRMKGAYDNWLKAQYTFLSKVHGGI